MDWYYWLPTALNRKHKRERAVLRDTVNSIIAQRRSANHSLEEEVWCMRGLDV